MKPAIALLMLFLTVCFALSAGAAEPEWVRVLAPIPVQERGRAMPLDTYAKNIAVQLTGRSSWKEGRGPEWFSGKHRVELLVALMFRPQQLMREPLIAVENRPFKKRLGLDPERRFFSFSELGSNPGWQTLLSEHDAAKTLNPNHRPTRDQRLAFEVQASLSTFAFFMAGTPIQIVPQNDSPDFLAAGISGGDPGTEVVQEALLNLRQAFVVGVGADVAAAQLVTAINASATLTPDAQRRLSLEIFYNNHQPWLMTAIFYGVAILALALCPVLPRKPLMFIALTFIVIGTAEQILGLYLRTAILGRAPVSNTYEALLWMGLVAIVIASAAQVINRKGWYLLAGLVAAELSVLFAMLVPLQDQTNTLPPVLRNNYWLIVHVLTIVASYGVLALSAVLAHVYLIKGVLAGKPGDVKSRMGHPLITQVYRCIQVGVLLLTAGTILGGVWAADSWGRFWGWDPKETWALISIVVYFILLHARHVGWLHDFGFAVSAVLAFLCIVWTFYGVNYVMAAGLHSYGFGSGGEIWVGLWALAEIVLVLICKLRFDMLRRQIGDASDRANPDLSDAAGAS